MCKKKKIDLSGRKKYQKRIDANVISPASEGFCVEIKRYI